MSSRQLIFISICFFLGQINGQNPSNRTEVIVNTADIWSFTLGDNAACKYDVQKYCIKKGAARLANMKVLKCVDELDNAVNLISKDCQTLIYDYKYNLTHNVYFDDAAKRFCQTDLKHLDECSQLMNTNRVGHLASCLYDALPNITEINCRVFIHQIQVITFTDWRLSEYFSDACINDIKKHRCGRLDDENQTLPHDQGSVLSCLSTHTDDLQASCSKEITRMVEMQSNDYHLDRSLYAACREDRLRLCATVTAGNGRVYRCLYEQKFNSLMSTPCRLEVHRRQTLVVKNALLDAPLMRACKSESVQHHCLANRATPDKTVPLIDFFLCLEDQMRADENFDKECKNEMLIHRQMLMTDYKLSPEILSQCHHDMISICTNFAQQGTNEALEKRAGKMVHCLLNSARIARNMSIQCRQAVNKLVLAVNPGKDIRADPILQGACQPVVNVLCPGVRGTEDKAVECLLENLKNMRMSEDCRERLLDIAYFMQRDWRITPGFAQSCQKNLVQFCGFPQNWTMTGILSDYKIGRYLTCLHDQQTKLERPCQEAFRRLISIRSQSVGLMPEIEDDCMQDLATCDKNDAQGEEMKCLQAKYHHLESDCKEAVRTHTKITMADPTLDFYLMKACESVIQSACKPEDLDTELSVLQCLVKQKTNAKMDLRCRTSINHHQITSLKDKAFLSSQFQQQCKEEIEQHCSQKKTKAEVVQCLADLVITDVLKNDKKINGKCREELKFELLQRGETIELDPLLFKACDLDIKKLCPNMSPGNAQVLECLKKKIFNTTGLCQSRLLKRGKLDVVMPSSDFSLTSKCNVPIQKFCSNDKQNVLQCLIRQLKHEKFSPECQQILYQRVMIYNTDVKFNKNLIESCQTDIGKYCQNIVVDNSIEDEDEDEDEDSRSTSLKDPDLGGRIIGCLREKYANSGNELGTKCVTELVDVIELSKMDISFDVQLYRKCRGILQAMCPGEDKEDCLRLLYQRNQIVDTECKQEVIRIIREGRADVHIDHALSFACQADVNKFCHDTPIGQARQLACLLKNKKSVSNDCKAILYKREELWRMIPDVDDIDGLAWHVFSSGNRQNLLTIIGVILTAVFLCGCVCRPCMRYRRVSKYK